jgi:hypothetical protein
MLEEHLGFTTFFH